MKRRSPWLTFAACAFLNGTLLAERPAVRVEQPKLTLSKAAIAAEAELESRGLAKDHAISSISLISGTGGNLCYVAEVEPPILSPADPAAQTRLAFQVEMDGRVMAKQIDPKYQRSRRFKSN